MASDGGPVPLSRTERALRLVHGATEGLIRRTSDQRAFFEVEDFPWVGRLEAQTDAIREEFQRMAGLVDRLPNFQALRENVYGLSQDDRWKVFPMWAYRVPVPENISRCPVTAGLVSEIPGMTLAMFSILRGPKYIAPHRGIYNGVLRILLPLTVPEPAGSCRIRVGDEVREYEEGKSLIFDDTFEHEVWNDAAEPRAVLFIDFLRPLPRPVSWVNRGLMKVFEHSPFIRAGAERLQEWEQQNGTAFDEAFTMES